MNQRVEYDVYQMPQISPYLNEEGRVNYVKLAGDLWLQEKLKEFEQTSIVDLDHYGEFAFWINAYILLILKSALSRLAKNPSWKGNLSIWSKFGFFSLTKHRIAQRKMSLTFLEHEILRKKFADPRLRFAINCASASCPVLFNRLYSGKNLDAFLTGQTKNFVTDSSQVHFEPEKNTLYLNPIFKWYRGDFKMAGGIIPFINKYVGNEHQIPEKAKIKFLKYDWSLNGQKSIIR
ncbi:MAG: DUF547 domain-containing protein [Promethearchaeota archaeon]